MTPVIPDIANAHDQPPSFDPRLPGDFENFDRWAYSHDATWHGVSEESQHARLNEVQRLQYLCVTLLREKSHLREWCIEMAMRVSPSFLCPPIPQEGGEA